MGVSPTFLMACRKAGLRPGRENDLGSLIVFGTAGSPLPAEGYRYVYEQLGPDVLLVNGSGVTHVCSGIVGGSPLLPVYEGEISGQVARRRHRRVRRAGRARRRRARRARDHPADAVHARRALGGCRRLAVSELVLRHVSRGSGARATGSSSRSAAAAPSPGRSDATLNRGGVRLGTGEFYGVVEELAGDADALVVHMEDDEGGAGAVAPFVVLVDGAELDDELRGTINRSLRSQLSPRHVPDTIRAVPAIPRTLTGKKLEAPAKRILRGDPVDAVASRDSLLDPTALDLFASFATAEPSLSTDVAEAGSERLSLEDPVAIDVHAHVEMSKAGRRLPPQRAARRGREALPWPVRAADGGGAGGVLPRSAG